MTGALPDARIPETVRRIHLIAICGTAMGALACMLKEMGYDVTGSDQHIYPPMSDFLRSRGIAIHEGFTAEHLNPWPDLVVVGNAVSRDNPEAAAMRRMGLPCCSMPQAINRFAAAGKRQIVVTGTHGKTTTSSFIAWLLQCAGLGPSFLIGGIVTDFNSNYRVGSGKWIVLEGDEYDTAYFDKGPKFLHYVPDIAVLTSIEFDHADIFSDLGHVQQAFQRFLEQLPPSAALVVKEGEPHIVPVLSAARCRVISYGQGATADWRLGHARVQPPHTFFDATFQGRQRRTFQTRMIGTHNLCNMLAGVAVGARLGISPDIVAHALASFGGVRRRQEVRGVKNGVVVIDDFAHHPTAVRETTRAVKGFYGDRRLIAVFEPRTNSSRRSVFQNIYPLCFDAADQICIRQASLMEKIPADQRFSSAQLVADLTARGKQARFFPDTDAIVQWLKDHARAGDVLLIMSNGGFDNIHGRLLDQL